MPADRVEETYRDLHPRLWRALLSFCGDPHVASDAASEAFAQALRRGQAIDDVGAWVWRAAFRIAGGMLARRSHDVGGLVDVEVSGLTPSLAEFLAMLGGLSTQQRACIVLRYVGGFTPAEVAELLDTSANSVRVQLHRAHKTLRRSLQEVHDG